MYERRRNLGHELMDEPGFGRQEALDTFRYLVPVNRLFGGTRPILSFMRRESESWARDRVYRFLDAGCGVGDVAIAVVRWGRRHGYRIEIDAIDRHPPTVELAHEKCVRYPEIRVRCDDVLALEEEKPYAYVYASQFLHHFSDAEVPDVLRRLLHLSRRKVIVSDLIYAPVHYLATWALTLFTSAVFRHDARMSVRRGFRLDDLDALLGRRGFHAYRLERHFLYRFLLIMDAVRI